MEKSALENDLLPTGQPTRESKLHKTRSPLIIVQSVLLFAIALRCFWSFSGLFPSSSISEDAIGAVKWWKCRAEGDDPRTECGYLIAPLDYFDASAGSAYIALSRYPATVQPRKGMILFNPGGPGGSGKSFVTRLGSLLQAMLGYEYDIVGFDPRGIGESLPSTKCFTDVSYDAYKRNTVLQRSYDVPSNMSREEARTTLVQQQREADALLKTQFEVCKKNMGDQLRYMGTATVVRDIDFITRKLEGEDALINFYGASYGTILGQYLVNMLPDRLGRVAIDGVADATAWASKPYYQWYRQWLSSTSDAYEIFLRRCSEVGPNVCALAQTEGEDPEKIKTRIENFFDGLYYEPLPASYGTVPSILTIGRARMFLLSSLEVPSSWIGAAKAIAEAMKGNTTTIINKFGFQFRDLERSAVSCNDNRPFAPPAPETVIDEALDVFQEVSRLVFSVFTTEPDGGCQYWPVTPPERFEGPWNHTLRNPMLIVSNTADPVTPISSGRLVQNLLGESARLLVQDSPGHCSLALPSECTVNAFRAYFANGTLPPPNTVCATDYPPFTDVNFGSLTDSEARRLSDRIHLGTMLHRVRKGLPTSDFAPDSTDKRRCAGCRQTGLHNIDGAKRHGGQMGL